MVDELETYTNTPPNDETRRLAQQILALHRTAVAILSNIHAAGEAKGWATVASELGPAATANMKAIYRAYRTAILTVKPAQAPPDVPGA